MLCLSSLVYSEFYRRIDGTRRIDLIMEFEATAVSHALIPSMYGVTTGLLVMELIFFRCRNQVIMVTRYRVDQQAMS